MQLHERISWAFAQKGLRPVERLLLLAICHRADKRTLQTWASIPTFAEQLGAGESTLREHLQSLRMKGLVRIHERSGKSSLLELTPPDSGGDPSRFQSPTPPDSGGDPSRFQRVSTQDPLRVSTQHPPNGDDKANLLPPRAPKPHAGKARRPALTDEEIGGLVNALRDDYESRDGPSKQAFAEWIEHVTADRFAWNTRTETAIRRHLGRWMRNRL